MKIDNHQLQNRRLNFLMRRLTNPIVIHYMYNHGRKLNDFVLNKRVKKIVANGIIRPFRWSIFTLMKYMWGDDKYNHKIFRNIGMILLILTRRKPHAFVNGVLEETCVNTNWLL